LLPMSVVEKTVLTEVEDVAVQLVERFRSLREENVKLKQQVTELQQDLEVLERDFGGKCDQVKLLERDRKKTLSSVERMLSSLATLEKVQG
jgi:cell division protein FtsB